MTCKGIGYPPLNFTWYRQRAGGQVELLSQEPGRVEVGEGGSGREWEGGVREEGGRGRRGEGVLLCPAEPGSSCCL